MQVLRILRRPSAKPAFLAALRSLAEVNDYGGGGEGRERGGRGHCLSSEMNQRNDYWKTEKEVSQCS